LNSIGYQQKWRWIVRDPRHYQIAVLGLLLVYGISALDFEIAASRAVLILTTALVGQYACTRLWHLPRFDARSALISGLSLCLLLRTSSNALALTAAIIAVASKFVIQINRKHVFNPTNIAIVGLMALTGQVWVSPGQWGNIAFFAFLMACLGGDMERFRTTLLSLDVVAIQNVIGAEVIQADHERHL